MFLVLLLSSISAYSQGTYNKKFSTANKSIIGVWIESLDVATVYGQMKVVIYTKNNKPYMALIATDGYIEKTMTKKKVGNTIRYYDNSSAFGEYYVIGNQGLKVYDSQGYITTYKKSRL
jgi:hypothetical protein